jgi:hypothetical protein
LQPVYDANPASARAVNPKVHVRLAPSVPVFGLMRMESKNFDESIAMADYDNAMQKASSLDIAKPSLSIRH